MGISLTDRINNEHLIFERLIHPGIILCASLKSEKYMDTEQDFFQSIKGYYLRKKELHFLVVCLITLTFM